jgi:hypothetical protein
VFVLSVLVVTDAVSVERGAVIMPVTVAVLAVLLLSLWARSMRFLRAHPGLQFLLWILSLAVLLAAPLSEAVARPQLAQSLQVAYGAIDSLAIFLLALVAVSAIWVIFDEAWVAAGWLEQRVNNPRRFELVVLLLLVVTATLSVGLYVWRWESLTFQEVAVFSFSHGMLIAALVYAIWRQRQRPLRPLSGGDPLPVFRNIATGCLAWIWLSVLLAFATDSAEELVFGLLRIPAILLLILFLIAGMLQVGTRFAELNARFPGRWNLRLLAIVLLTSGAITVGTWTSIFPFNVILSLILLLLGPFVPYQCLILRPDETLGVLNSLSGTTQPGSTHRFFLYLGMTVLVAASAVFQFTVRGSAEPGLLVEHLRLLSNSVQTNSYQVFAMWLLWRYRVEIATAGRERLERIRADRERGGRNK